MRKNGDILKYTAAAAAAVLLAVGIILLASGGYLPGATSDAAGRDEFAYQTDDKILEDLLKEGDESATVQSAYDKYLSSLPKLSGAASAEFVPGVSHIALSVGEAPGAASANTVMPAPAAAYDIPSGYTAVGYQDGILLLEKNGLYGYYLESGRWLTDPVYSEAFAFSGGLAVVRSGGYYGAVDTAGNLVIPTVFSALSDCVSGVLTAGRGNSFVLLAVSE